MAEWLQLDRFRINRQVKRILNGVELEVMVSPFDVPMAVKGEYDKEKKRFVIEFQYPSEREAVTEESLDRTVRVAVGKQSHRLFEISVDVHALEADSVGLKLTVPFIAQRLEKAIERYKPPRWREGNYRLAGQVILDRQGELFAGLESR